MKLETITELFQLISRGVENINSRKQSIELRTQGFESLIENGFTKNAFDTRRINQETEFNPRRGLQNYNRSEQFLTQATANKVASLTKLQNILEAVKAEYGADKEWHDSKTRVLLSTLNNGLRTATNDGDYTGDQPGMGSLSYIEELLDMRYRLRLENIDKLAAPNIRTIILSKDESLEKNHNKQDEEAVRYQPVVKAQDEFEITNRDVGTKSYDTLMEKLFGGVRASKENSEVERTVTITIKDTVKEKEPVKKDEDKAEDDTEE